jgi:hypothetical protein
LLFLSNILRHGKWSLGKTWKREAPFGRQQSLAVVNEGFISHGKIYEDKRG